MASRNRVIYQSEGIYVSQEATSSGSGSHCQLQRVQSANYSYTINRQDVNQYGQLARIDSLVLDPPTVSVDFSYYLTDGFNERALGFYVQTGDEDSMAVGTNESMPQGNFVSGLLTAGSGDNIYIVTSPEGDDLNLGNDDTGWLGSTIKVIGIGNCYLSDYSVDLSVGSLPTASVTMEGSNMASSAGAEEPNIANPAVDQEAGTPAIQTPVDFPSPTTGLDSTIKALRPGDITMTLSNFKDETIAELEAGEGPINIQSASLSIPLSRTPLDRLGSKFAYARTVDFPVVTTLSVSALMNEESAMNLANKLEEPERDVQISLHNPSGSTSAQGTGVIIDFKGALVDSESFSSSIGSNKTVDLTFSAQIGGPEDIAAGVFMSGINWKGNFSGDGGKYN
jgi:hypothetical protein